MKLRDLERHLISRVTAVPRHREVGPGLVRAICDQLDVPRPQAR